MPRSNSLLAYIPSRLLELLKRDPAPFPAPPWEERVVGAVMFVDVSGFTQLSEMLTREGPSGTERLTQILNHFYLWLVAGVESAGGYVARFSGDALTAVFPGRGPQEPLQDAVRAGLELIHTAFRNPPELVDGMDFPLRIKIGISAGPIFSAAVGSARGELRFLIAGQAVREASAASSLCGPMEVLVPKRLSHLLPEDVNTLEAPGDHLTVVPALLRRGLHVPVLREPPGPLELPASVPEERLSRFVPAVIEERVHLGLSELLAEHRPVTVLFARFDGIDFDDPASSQPFERFMNDVFDQVAAHHGTIDKIEQGDKGNIIMALFGAPRALECPEEVAVACAWALRQRFFSDTGLRISRIGINSGLVYAGDVGAPWRRDYTVMGDAVNVASRVTSNANPGEVLISARVRARVGDWQVGAPRQQTLKGRSEPVQVFPIEAPPSAGGEPDQEVIELPDRGDLLVGRATEVALLDLAIRRLRDGRPGMIVIEGEIGVGKSRLVAYVTEQVFAFGRVIAQRVRPAVSSPYEFWQWPILELVGGPGPDLEDRLSRSFQRFDGRAAPWLSLFNPLLGTTFPSSPQLEAAEPRFREQMLLDLVVSMLLNSASSGPLLLVLDDFHEADTASATLLRYLASRLEDVPLLVVVAARPGAQIPDPEEAPQVLRLSLNPLDRSALEALVRSRIGDRADDALVGTIWERSQGNPLFAEELLHSLRQGGLVAGPALEGGEPEPLPESLRSVLQSRIDELPETCRAVAKVAAVIGSRFSRAALAAGFKEGIDPAFLERQLELLVQARVISPQAHPTEETYEFRHVLSREVIYSAMTQVQQVELHRRIGLWLEQSGHPVTPGVLAHHFERGHDYPRALRYHLEAAAQAYQAFANEEAILGYDRALALADEHWLSLPDGVTRAQILEEQGDVYFRIGAYRKAEGLYRKVRSIAPDWLSVVRNLRKEGEARLRADDVPNALRCFDEALLLLKVERGTSLFGVLIPMALNFLRDLVSGPPNRPGAPLPEADRPRYIELDHVYSVMGIALYYEGSRQLLEVVHRMATVALRLGQPGRIARTYAALALIYASVSMFRLSKRYVDASQQWLEQETDGLARVTLRGTASYAVAGAARRIAGDWPGAEALHLQGAAANQAIGDVWEQGLSLINLAIMWRVRGYHPRAMELHARIIRLSQEGDQFLYLREAMMCDALCLAEIGRFDDASAELEKVLAMPGLHTLGRVRALAHRGWLKYLQGRPQAGLADLAEAVQIITSRRMYGEHVSEILVWWYEVLLMSGASRWKVRKARNRASRTGRRLPSLQGALVLVRGLEAMKRGNAGKARALFARAAGIHRAMDRGRESARALLWQASVQRDRAAVLRSEAGKLLRDRGLPELLPGGPPALTPAGLTGAAPSAA